MMAANLAELLHARKIGTKRWQARCPAHGDHSPSLAISEGREGRTLLKCWAGCSLDRILKAASLSPTDLFLPTRPMSSAEAREFQRRRLAAEARVEALKMVSREIFDAERLAEIEVRRLGAELGHLREGDARERELIERFHRACSIFNIAEWESLRIVRLAGERHAIAAYLPIARGERVA